MTENYVLSYNFITIEGCIGAGKTTLSKMLAQEFNAQLILEQFEDNPFLPGFYQDPERHAFPKSLIFANQNLKSDEAKLYRMLFDIINPSLPKPDLIIYLYAPVEKLLSNIKHRGRDYEQSIPA
ncbi:unnamed protein product, partial [Darwinula stevensoni]